MPLTYAIGDVHGRSDLLAALLEAIGEDMAGRAARIVFLGDVIDRGPDSRGCLDLVIGALAQYPDSQLVLGNHEEFLLRFITPDEDHQDVVRVWYPNGGIATLQSYGLDARDPIDSLATTFAREFPGHVATLRAASWMVESEHHALVHGGIDPHLGLAAQEPRTTRWIREKFLSFAGPLPKTIVHGHTPTESNLPEIHPNRIAIDTGAYYSGHLTCVVLNGATAPRFLTTSVHDGHITVRQAQPLDRC
ncbi:metallophosphoesterase family protein [Hoeflea sp.]|uniref:metallophosphoesterase family protein n=1 Tax=Hoeflea sp. TaxID=1940281 RepID=UPI003A8F351B